MIIIEFKNSAPITNKPLNGFYEVSKKQERNGKFLRKYWSLMDFTAFNLPEGLKYTIDLSLCTKEMLHEIIKSIQGVESISFAKMKEDDFEKYYSDTLDHCCKLLGVAKETVINELVGYF